MLPSNGRPGGSRKIGASLPRPQPAPRVPLLDETPLANCYNLSMTDRPAKVLTDLHIFRETATLAGVQTKGHALRRRPSYTWAMPPSTNSSTPVT